MRPEQDCLQCGKCCEKWGWDQKGVPEDIIPWINGGRRDILQHVSVRFHGGKTSLGTEVTLGEVPGISRIYYWVDPKGRALSYCPFYRKAGDGKVYCGIHDSKPAVCIGFAPWAEVWHDYGLNCPACREIAP